MHPRKRRNAGYNLVELLVVMTLVGAVSAAVLTFYVQSYRSSYASERQIELLGMMRQFTSELIYNGSRAHEVVLYESAEATERTFAKRKTVLNAETASTTDDISPTGNFALFIYYELPKPAAEGRYRIQKLIGYYLETVDSGPPQLVRVTVDLGSSPSTLSPEDILDTRWATAPRAILAPRVNPLALSDNSVDTTVPQLFYRRASQNLAVCGQFQKSAHKTSTKDARTYTRTFYFTVTVRS